MNIYSRIAVFLAALLLVGTYVQPLWRIDLWAPQYPEGLVMKIWLNKLSGDVEVINGLNHYIGMAPIKTEMFPEFTYLPIIVGVYVGLGLLTALFGRFRLLATYLGALALAGGVALYDFWRWAYDYGHNLDPQAPIQVPGMAYQPPLIGYKALLNFGAYSIPDVGGWLFLLAGLLVVGATVLEWLWIRNPAHKPRNAPQTRSIKAALFGFVWLIQGCGIQPDPIHYGQDACQYCKMTIVDQRYGVEYLTHKGKAFKFDDVACMAHYLAENNVAETDVALLLVNDFLQPGQLVDARRAGFIRQDQFHSPMGGNTAAFGSLAQARKQANGTRVLRWNDLKKHIN